MTGPDWPHIRGVLFDVDGTLYGQTLTRLLMGLELLSLVISLRSVGRAATVWRAIGTFRRVREELRAVPPGRGDLARLQYTETATRVSADVQAVEHWVDEWIVRRPLKYVRLSRRGGLLTFLTDLEHQGIQTGVLSDYPAEDKLQALGLAGRFSLVLCATDPEIGAFKPHPAGFLRACHVWGLRPDQVLYIGDRPEVDAAGAAAAGMPCVIISRASWWSRSGAARGDYVTVPFYGRLQRVFTRPCRA